MTEEEAKEKLIQILETPLTENQIKFFDGFLLKLEEMLSTEEGQEEFIRQMNKRLNGVKLESKN